MKSNYKYEGLVHNNPDRPNVKFLGTVHANNIKELKENARILARNQNEHGCRLHIECRDIQRLLVRIVAVEYAENLIEIQ
jgi:hypothetical protein